MIAIVDYNAGNIKSVCNALDRLGAEYVLTDQASCIESAAKVILPGVGNAAEAMRELRERGLVETIRGLRRPVLGICVGMQLMCRHSEEGDTPCMDIFDCDVRRFVPAPDAKVPHMGWNAISNLEKKLFTGIPRGSFVYFVHSYRPDLCQDTIATCRHGADMFSAALKYEKFYGTQFHPEKSGGVGEKILQNFLAL
ncbi:MAG: imidazole glycerol phosphate synthase subunit HisH [Bacteroidales bacterium]|nr:imidazole glycerol phosphate synthase subunit HisH [Bacteroidales bacterium]